MGDALDETAGIDEDERGAMLQCELLKALVDFVPHFVGGNRAKLAGGEFDGEIERAGGGDDDSGGHGVVPTFANSG